MKKRLSELQPSERAKVLEVAAIDHSAGLRQRLIELGFVAGTVVEVVSAAPFGGDPMVVDVRGTLLALRREEAARVYVEER